MKNHVALFGFLLGVTGAATGCAGSAQQGKVPTIPVGTTFLTSAEIAPLLIDSTDPWAQPRPLDSSDPWANEAAVAAPAPAPATRTWGADSATK